MGSFDCQSGIQNPPKSTSPFVVSTYKSDLKSPLHSTSYSKTSGKRGGRKGNKSRLSGILQSPLSCPKERRLVETNHRSLSPESSCGQRVFQDGDSCLNSVSYSSWPLGRVLRSVRRILSRSHSRGVKTFAKILSRKCSLSVPSHAFRSLLSSKSFYKTHESCSRPSTARRIRSPSIFRRLAATSDNPPIPLQGSGPLLEDSVRTRPHSQSSEIGTSSVSRFRVCRDELPYSRECSASASNTSAIYPTSVVSDSNPKQSLSQVLPVSSGSPERSSRLCRSGSPSLTTTTILSASSMASKPRLSLGCTPITSNLPPSSSLVEEREEVSGRSPSRSPPSRSVSNHRFEQKRVGGTFGTSRSPNIRCLEPRGGLPTHKQPGTESSLPSSLPFSSSSVSPHCVPVHGQHNSCGLHSTSRGNSQFIPLRGSSEVVPIVSTTQYHTPSQVPSGQAKRLGRQPVPGQSNSAFGMVSESLSHAPDFQSSGETYGGPVCNQVQQSAPSVCVPNAGPSSLGSGCSIPVLGQSVCLRFPPDCPNSNSATEDSSVKLPNSSNSPLLAPETLVQPTVGASCCSTSSASVQNRPPQSERRSSAPKSRPLLPSRLAVIREGLRKRKFSPRVASLIAKARRSSTSAVYNAKWRIYTDWCSEREIDPIRPSIQNITEFLAFLFVDKELAVSTIKGYRAMLSHTLSFRGIKDVGSNHVISDLIRSFELARPVTRSLTPKWDLSCVLWSLTKAPYEPLAKASLSHLTWKTVFLLTMASAKRRSEIHALSIEDNHIRFNADDSVTLLCQTGFLAKTQLPSVAPKPFTIPSLSRDLSRSDPDRTLCPVRALKFYLDKVKTSRGSRKRLFIPVKGKQEISAASISRWVASTIRVAYSELTDQDLNFLQIRPHELRALSTSWAFVNKAPLEDILSAATWKQASTFSSFYLRSLSSCQGNLFSLGPIVVAQTVVSKAD